MEMTKLTDEQIRRARESAEKATQDQKDSKRSEAEEAARRTDERLHRKRDGWE